MLWYGPNPDINPNSPSLMPIRIAIIGAGSLGFTRRLIQDVLSVPELQDTVFALTDISADNLEMVARLVKRDIEANKLKARVESTTDRRKAFKGAKYVICAIRQGGLEAFKTDVEIPLRYGIDQCVGDTICAGGLMYAQRTIGALLDICRDIREVALPGAVLLNYSNPMAMNTIACNRWGGVPTIGLCHGVQGAHWQLAYAVEYFLKDTGRLPKDYASDGVKLNTWEGVPFPFGFNAREIDIICAGINHQTWFVGVSWRGEDMLQAVRDYLPRIPHFAKTEKVRLDVLKRFGYYSTESNGHLSEYLPWYRKRPERIRDWIDLNYWINGETGGYLRVCTEGRKWFETDYPNWLKEPAPKIGPDNRSEEHGSYIIEALETGRAYRGHFNIINQGHITNIPNGACIELPGYVDRNGVSIPVIGTLPAACAATCSVSANVQLMGAEAAVTGNLELLKQAMLHDPLVGAVCEPEEVWQMTDELLVAQAEWLPQYAASVAGAKKRLAAHVKAGTRVQLRETEGAARLKTKTVEEMAQDAAAARANAGTADKGRAGQTNKARKSAKR